MSGAWQVWYEGAAARCNKDGRCCDGPVILPNVHRVAVYERGSR